jgi:hypothetical protein
MIEIVGLIILAVAAYLAVIFLSAGLGRLIGKTIAKLRR